MSDEKSSPVEPPPYVVMTASLHSAETKPGGPGAGRFQRNKRSIILSVVIVLIVAAAVIALPIVFMQEQQAILEFELAFMSSQNNNVSQKVQSDPNANVVQYHVTAPGQDVYVVDDFNQGIETVRIELTSTGQTTCYVTPLNISAALSPSQITGPESMSGSSGYVSGKTYVLSGPPVADTSFLTPKAATLCAGVSLYWIQPDCGSNGQQVNPNNTTPAPAGSRKKRTLYYEGTFDGVPCLGGCCLVTCASSVTIVEYITGLVHTCHYYLTTSPRYPYYYYYNWPMAGLVCPAYGGVYYGVGRK